MGRQALHTVLRQSKKQAPNAASRGVEWTAIVSARSLPPRSTTSPRQHEIASNDPGQHLDHGQHHGRCSGRRQRRGRVDSACLRRRVQEARSRRLQTTCPSSLVHGPLDLWSAPEASDGSVPASRLSSDHTYYATPTLAAGHSGAKLHTLRLEGFRHC